jgi:hypothetical protein
MNGRLTTGFKNPTIITAQQYGTKVSVEIDHSDTDLDELFDAFHTLVIGMGYSEDSWKQCIVGRADEYEDDNIYDMGIYEPSPELIKAMDEYNKLADTERNNITSEQNTHQ